MPHATLHDEAGRLGALRRLEVLDTEPEEAFESVVSLVRTVLRVPIATVTLVDADRQWFKARSGMPFAETPRAVSFCTHTIRQDDAFVIPDATTDARFASSPLVIGDPHIRSYAGIPLKTAEGYNVGALCAIDTQPRTFAAAELAILRNFANLVVNELELRRIAQRDPLTGMLNRRGFLDRAMQEIERYQRYRRPGSLLMVDIDHFKQVNDTHGHPAGDAVLHAVATVLGETVRPSDVVGRLGGEEFGILLPETGAGDALLAAERLRASIQGSRFAVAEDVAIGITASFGIAPVDEAVRTAEDWIARADAPLYASKRDGRNRCTVVAPAAKGVGERAAA